MKVRIRNNDGTPAHKSEFRLDDRSSVVTFLNLLKDKFGVDCFGIRGEFQNKHSDIKEEKKHLDEWREKTRSLREPDKELQRKVRESL